MNAALKARELLIDACAGGFGPELATALQYVHLARVDDVGLWGERVDVVLSLESEVPIVPAHYLVQRNPDGTGWVSPVSASEWQRAQEWVAKQPDRLGELAMHLNI